MRNNSIIPFQELQFRDDFMFGAVMQNTEICKMFLETLLDTEIERIELVDKQKDLSDVPWAHGIRLDVYVKDGKGTIYNVEMQKSNEDDLDYRVAYYLSGMHRDVLRKGEDYEQMRRCYVIFVCDFDFYKQKLAVNEWEVRIKGTDHIIDPGFETFVLNDHYKIANCNKGIQDFLDYVRTGTAKEADKSELTRKIHKEVDVVRKDSKMEVLYMTLTVKLQQEYQKGVKQGITQGILAVIRSLKKVSASKEAAVDALMDQFSLSQEEAVQKVNENWDS